MPSSPCPTMAHCAKTCSTRIPSRAQMPCIGQYVRYCTVLSLSRISNILHWTRARSSIRLSQSPAPLQERCPFCAGLQPRAVWYGRIATYDLAKFTQLHAVQRKSVSSFLRSFQRAQRIPDRQNERLISAMHCTELLFQRRPALSPDTDAAAALPKTNLAPGSFWRLPAAHGASRCASDAVPSTVQPRNSNHTTMLGQSAFRIHLCHTVPSPSSLSPARTFSLLNLERNTRHVWRREQFCLTLLNP